MNTYGTRLGIIKQVLGLSYRELLEKLGNFATERSLRNYIETKTQIPGNIISLVTDVFPEINSNWWHTGVGQVLTDGRVPFKQKNATAPVSDNSPQYNLPSENNEIVSIPASELFKAMFKDMKEVNQLLQSRLEYYEVFIRSIDKFKI